MTFREILAEFAAHRQGIDPIYEVHVFLRVNPRLDPLYDFDIEDPQAMAAERERLERAQRSRPVLAPKVPRIPRVTPCEHCGADVLENLHGGNVTRFCSDACRFAAAYREKIASGKCRKARCESDAEAGKTYCRPHLDAIAAYGRAQRQQRTADTRKAA